MSKYIPLKWPHFEEKIKSSREKTEIIKVVFYCRNGGKIRRCGKRKCGNTQIGISNLKKISNNYKSAIHIWALNIYITSANFVYFRNPIHEISQTCNDLPIQVIRLFSRCRKGKKLRKSFMYTYLISTK